MAATRPQIEAAATAICQGLNTALVAIGVTRVSDIGAGNFRHLGRAFVDEAVSRQIDPDLYEILLSFLAEEIQNQRERLPWNSR